MAVSDVQLDTGINVGRAQVFKPLDVQELFDAKQRKKAADELAKANKLKEQEAKKAKVKAEVADYGALKAHREKLDIMAKEILDMAEKTPDSPEIPKKIYNYAVAGRTAQDLKKAYDDLGKTLYKDADHLIYGEDELNDALSEEIELSAQPDFDVVASSQRLGEKIRNVKSIPKDKGYTTFIQDTAKKMGDDLTKSMDANLTAYEKESTKQAAKNAGWETLKANNRVDNGIRQMMEDDPALTRDDAMKKLKDIYDYSFDTKDKTTLDKTEAKKEWKYDRGSGTAYNDLWTIVRSVDKKPTGELSMITTSKGKKRPANVFIYDTKAVTDVPLKKFPVWKENEHGGETTEKVFVDAVIQKQVEVADGVYETIVAVPEFTQDANGGKKFSGWSNPMRVVGQEGADMVAAQTRTNLTKLHNNIGTEGVTEVKGNAPSKTPSYTQKQTSAIAAFKKQLKREPTAAELDKLLKKYK